MLILKIYLNYVLFYLFILSEYLIFYLSHLANGSLSLSLAFPFASIW